MHTNSLSLDTCIKLKAVKFSLEHNHFFAFMNISCPLSKSLGLRSETRIEVGYQGKFLIATLIALPSSILKCGHMGLSKSAWEKLGLKGGSKVSVKLVEPPVSFGSIKKKLYGHPFTDSEFRDIIKDIAEKRYSDVQMTSFLNSCIALTKKEVVALTQAMIDIGPKVTWPSFPVVDKHGIGGIPGNRISMIIVPILAAFGLTIPKTSSRAITSPAGTADTMEVLAPVTLSLGQMRKVVEKEGGCLVWGGDLGLSPADNILSQVEYTLGIDSPNQFVASILSKKIAIGSTHVLIDIPLGPTAKIRSAKEAKHLSDLFQDVAKTLGITVHVMETDGYQPIGCGIGPVLEARDVLSVLRSEEQAPQSLKQKALLFAGFILETWGGVPKGQGIHLAETVLTEGHALKKFEAICTAQGGMREPVLARYSHVIEAPRKGIISGFSNYCLSRTARLAGAPSSPAAGIDLHVSLHSTIEKGQPLLTLYASSKGELAYALNYFLAHQDMITIKGA